MSSAKQPDNHDSDARNSADAAGLGSLADLDEELARAADAAEALSNDLGQPDPPAQQTSTSIDTANVPSPEKVLSDELARLEGLAQTAAVELGASPPAAETGTAKLGASTPAAEPAATELGVSTPAEQPAEPTETTETAGDEPTTVTPPRKDDAGAERDETHASSETPSDHVEPAKKAAKSEQPDPEVESTENEASIDASAPSDTAADQQPDPPEIAVDVVSPDQPTHEPTVDPGGRDAADDTAATEPVVSDSNDHTGDVTAETTNPPTESVSAGGDEPATNAVVGIDSDAADAPEEDTSELPVASSAERPEPPLAVESKIVESKTDQNTESTTGGVEAVAGIEETAVALDDLDAALAAAAEAEHPPPETPTQPEGEVAIDPGTQTDTKNPPAETDPQEAVPSFMRDLMGSADEPATEAAPTTTGPQEPTLDAADTSAAPSRSPSAAAMYQSQGKPGVVGTGMLGVVGSTPPPPNGTPDKDVSAVVNGEGADSQGDGEDNAAGASVARPSLRARLTPFAFQATNCIVTLLAKIDQPLKPIGPRVRLIAGWAALATFGTALVVFLVALF